MYLSDWELGVNFPLVYWPCTPPFPFGCCQCFNLHLQAGVFVLFPLHLRGPSLGPWWHFNFFKSLSIEHFTLRKILRHLDNEGYKEKGKITGKFCLFVFILWVTPDGAKMLSIEVRIPLVAKLSQIVCKLLRKEVLLLLTWFSTWVNSFLMSLSSKLLFSSLIQYHMKFQGLATLLLTLSAGLQLLPISISPQTSFHPNTVPSGSKKNKK